MEMNQPIADTLEEARVQVAPDSEEAAGQVAASGDDTHADTPEMSSHGAGFVGPLLLLDRIVLGATFGIYVLAMAFLFLGKAEIWLTTLGLILVVALLDGVILHFRGSQILVQDRTIRRFMYGIPLAFFCFYSAGLIREQKQCRWHIAIANPGIAKVCTYVAGLVVVLSMALAALRVDRKGSVSVTQRVRGGRCYALWHVLFRFTELSFRLGTGVLLCEGLHVVLWSAQLGHPVLLCAPFLALVVVYFATFQAANLWGSKPMDRIVPCLVVGVVALAMNPMHFFARPGFDGVVRKSNKYLFVIRVLEVALAVGFLYKVSSMKMPDSAGLLCKDLTGWDMVRQLGPLAMCQVVVSLALHYLIMALHDGIKHSTCQALVDDGPRGAELAFDALREPRSFFVPPAPGDVGLSEAWVQLGGGVPLSPLAEERPPEEVNLVQHRIVGILGGGSFGVVAKTAADEPSGGEREYAAKFLNISDQHQRQTTEREVQIYKKVWSESRMVAPGHRRVGHPNIVRLYFWTSYPVSREFSMAEGGDVVRHPNHRNTWFHVLLMMELCKTNLKTYLHTHSGSPADWFEASVRFLAEIQLGLAFLHGVNISYRDLKLENVLVVKRHGADHCKLGDFGYGRVVDPQVSVAGSPYFCAPEMKDWVEHGTVIRATQTEENALDTYSYGTLAFLLGQRVLGIQGIRMEVHPCCRARGADRCQECAGCQLLRDFCQRLAPVDPQGHLADVVGSCVAFQARMRPAVADLKYRGLFQDVNFDALARQDL